MFDGFWVDSDCSNGRVRKLVSKQSRLNCVCLKNLSSLLILGTSDSEPRSESDARVSINNENFTSFFFNSVLEPKVSSSDSDTSKRLNQN